MTRLKWNRKITSSTIYGAIIAPTPEKVALAPIAEFLTTVGNSSAENRYIVANAADDPNFPIIDRTNTIISVAVNNTVE